jgi:hypothetical protein
MLIGSWDVQKIGVWLFLPAFILFAIIMPAAGPPGTPAEAITLIAGLVIISAIILISLQHIRTEYRFRIASRGPPTS